MYSPAIISIPETLNNEENHRAILKTELIECIILSSFATRTTVSINY
jgi:hypothetical protein